MRRKNGEIIDCPVCGTSKYFRLARLLRGAKYCSRKCADIAKVGIIPTNLKLAQSMSPIGKKGNSYHARGEKHWAWQRENPSYRAVHSWIRNHYGLATKCENPLCRYPRKDARGNLMIAPKSYQWANISREYKRDRADFIELCASCHKEFDLEYKRNNSVG